MTEEINKNIGDEEKLKKFIDQKTSETEALKKLILELQGKKPEIEKEKTRIKKTKK
jgi:hypothetical protein